MNSLRIVPLMKTLRAPTDKADVSDFSINMLCCINIAWIILKFIKRSFTQMASQLIALT